MAAHNASRMATLSAPLSRRRGRPRRARRARPGLAPAGPARPEAIGRIGAQTALRHPRPHFRRPAFPAALFSAAKLIAIRSRLIPRPAAARPDPLLLSEKLWQWFGSPRAEAGEGTAARTPLFRQRSEDAAPRAPRLLDRATRRSPRGATSMAEPTNSTAWSSDPQPGLDRARAIFTEFTDAAYSAAIAAAAYQKERAARQLAAIAEAVRAGADTLDRGQSPVAARYAEPGRRPVCRHVPVARRALVGRGDRRGRRRRAAPSGAVCRGGHGRRFSCWPVPGAAGA